MERALQSSSQEKQESFGNSEGNEKTKRRGQNLTSASFFFLRILSVLIMLCNLPKRAFVFFPLLLDINSNTTQISTSLLLHSIHILHSRSISNEMQPLLLALCPSFPDRTTLETISIRIVDSDKTSPVCLCHRDDGSIDGGVRGRCITPGVFRTPDGGDFDGVSDSSAGCCGRGVNDIPVVVVDVFAVEGCGVDI
jgi:hypothetical protein